MIADKTLVAWASVGEWQWQACPIVLVRGAGLESSEGGSSDLLRDRSIDLFR